MILKELLEEIKEEYYSANILKVANPPSYSYLGTVELYKKQLPEWVAKYNDWTVIDKIKDINSETGEATITVFLSDAPTEEKKNFDHRAIRYRMIKELNEIQRIVAWETTNRSSTYIHWDELFNCFKDMLNLYDELESTMQYNLDNDHNRETKATADTLKMVLSKIDTIMEKYDVISQNQNEK